MDVFTSKMRPESVYVEQAKKRACRVFALLDYSGVVLNFELYTGKVGDDH
jgi:hypothetical protein